MRMSGKVKPGYVVRPRRAMRRWVAVAAVGVSSVALGAAGAAGGVGAAGAAASVTSGPVSAATIGATGADAASRGSSGLRLPGASGRGPVGAHGIYPLPVYLSGERPTQLPQADYEGAISAANSYWSGVTGGKITVRAGWAMPPWTKLDLTAAQVDSCDRDAIHKAARDKVGSGGERDHLVVILNDLPQCDFSDLYQFGLTGRGDGYSIINIGFERDVALKALAFNGGVPAAGSLNCVNGIAPVPLSTTCTFDPYNNPWDPASDHPYNQVGTPLADTLATLGVLGASDFPQIDPGADRSLTIAPLTATSGQRGFSFVLGRYRYVVDYRIPVGQDAWIDDKVWDGAFGRLADPGGGVIVHRQDLNAEPYVRARLVLDFHPDTVNSGTARHPGLAAGESFTAPGGLFALNVTSATAAGATVNLSFPSLARVERWAGSDRYATSAEISRRSYGSNVPVAYIASGEVYTDALSGASVAGMESAPVLLVDSDAIPSVIAAELTRLNPGRIVIFGGPATISPAVESALDAYTTGTVVRWSGGDRYATSAAISRESYPAGVATAYVASGRVFPDALSGAPVGGMSDGPVLLVDTTRVPGIIATELTRLNPGKIVVFGGASTVTEGTRAELMQFTSGRVDRWWGGDRYSTSAQIVANAYPGSGGTVYIASGRVFTDALSGAPVAGKGQSPILLVDTDTIPATVAAELERLAPSRIVIFGGPATISLEVQAALADYLP